ncbi:MAG: hypothetical protein AAF211_23190 [Myxococcota bacterium]
MNVYALLEGWPRASRTGLLVATGGGLAVATVTLPFLGLAPLAYDGAILVVVAGLAGMWGITYRGMEGGLPMATPSDDRAVRHRGLIAGRWLEQTSSAVGLPEIDPTFSLIGWSTAIREGLADRMDGKLGPVHVAGVEGSEVTARALVWANQTLDWVEARFRRTGDRLTPLAHRTVAPPIPLVEIDPAWPAARRALISRDEALDVEAFEVLFDQINAELDGLVDADATTRAASPYLTEEGARSLAFWADGPGLPPAGSGAAWLTIEEDAWHERIEVQCGLRVLGLCRTAGASDAPWRLWRLRRGG